MAAICAAPKFVLPHLGDVSGLEFTCYDGCEDTLVSLGASFVRRPFAVCGRIITGRGPGHAMDFAFAILGAIKGPGAAASVKDAMVLETVA